MVVVPFCVEDVEGECLALFAVFGRRLYRALYARLGKNLLGIEEVGNIGVERWAMRYKGILERGDGKKLLGCLLVLGNGDEFIVATLHHDG